MAPDSYAADESEDTARSELLAALDEQLASLGEADRTALALRFFQGLPLAQVGEAMGSSADAAQKRIARAMQSAAEAAAHTAAAHATAEGATP